ncbi:MAG: hypothetical protein AMXMBFR83_25590 [Phycisphaerae bacterium]
MLGLRLWKRALVLVAGSAIGWLAGEASASLQLTAIAPLGDDTTTTARAITPDGQFVVGQSGTGTGFVWDAVNGTRTFTGAAHTSTNASGVGYRVVNGNTQLIAHGRESAGWSGEWFSSDGGLTWTSRRDVNVFSSGSLGLPAANSLRGTNTDVYYDVWINIISGAGRNHYTSRGSGDPVTVLRSTATTGAAQGYSLNGVSATGRAVGSRLQSGNPRNLYVDFTNPGTPADRFFPGLDGTIFGTALAISADGMRIFGTSAATGKSGNWPYLVIDPKVLPEVSGATIELPTYADVIGGTRAQPLGCTDDGRFAVGNNFREVGERAVLWNLTDPDPANWTVKDLTVLFSAQGLMGDFKVLTRATSVGRLPSGELVITGIGINMNDQTRAFVATIPEPATLGLLATGALLMRRRRR